MKKLATKLMPSIKDWIKEELIKPKNWNASELQYRVENSFSWSDCGIIGEFRLKPTPDYSNEIDALNKKANENGMKAVINFIKL